MKIKKIFIVFIASIFVAFFTGCTKPKKNMLFNAKIMAYGSINGELKGQGMRWYKHDFLSKNKISDAMYYNESYDKNDPYSEEYIWYENCPKRLVFIIDSLEKSKEIFDDEFISGQDVNFDNEMCILYLFASTNCTYELEEVFVENNCMYIGINHIVHYTTDPEPTILVIKMDKIDMQNMNVKFI